jgi:CubicO group peptidase (beta-lactamase class C family)
MHQNKGYLNIFLIMGILCILIIGSCKENSSLSDSDDHSLIEKMLARADSVSLGTKYNPPPGDALSHHASGLAKVLCSAVFISGLDFEFAAENIGYFSAPFAERSKFQSRTLDPENKAVHVTLPNGVVRTAKYYGDQGCICLPEGEEEPFFTPVNVYSSLPPADSQNWPMGDLQAEPSVNTGINKELVDEAVQSMFVNPDHMTAAFIVTHKGQIISEQYKTGINKNTRLESWSMGKSLTATLMGILIQQGVYTLDQRAPIPEWNEKAGDLRAEIKIRNILNMSSGLYCRAPQDPDFDTEMGYPDHLYVYTGSANSFKYAASLPQQWPPGIIGRYRNSDPVLTNYLIRLAVEGRGEEYHSFPQRALFDKIGVRNMIMETDPYGNFLLQGYEFGTARDWARIGNLYLNNGEWDGEQILTKEFIEFARTLAPPWVADGRPVYGGFFWINGDGGIPIPEDAYYMAGAGGQYTFIIPSHDLVVVRLTHYKGGGPGNKTFHEALRQIVEAVEGK